MSLIQQTQELLRTKIPITCAMDVRVEDYYGECLVLIAPMEANVNHLGTAFGGSLNTLAVLSGYGLLWLEMQNTACHIVEKARYHMTARSEVRSAPHACAKLMTEIPLEMHPSLFKAETKITVSCLKEATE